jgi:PAS domain S-box-containing protein
MGPWIFILPSGAALIAIAGAIGQVFGLPWLVSMGAGFIPLAPLSMGMILLVVAGFFALPSSRGTMAIRRGILMAGLLVFLLGLAVLIQNFLPGWLGRRALPLFLSKAAAQVSPLTAIAIGGTGLALTLAANPWFSKSLRQVGSLLSLIPMGIGLFILFGYLVGVPALYGSDLIPMSIPAALCAVLLGLAMLLAAGHDTWPQSLFILNSNGSSDLPTLMGRPFGIFLALVFSLWIGGSLFLRNHVVNARQSAGENLQTIADLKTKQIQDWYQERLGDAAQVQHSTLIHTSLRDFLTGRHGITRSQVEGYLETFQDAHLYRRIALFDASGNVRVWIGVNEPLDADDRRTLKTISTTDIQRIDLHEEAGGIRLGFMVPIQDARSSLKRPLGVLLFEIDARDYLFPLVQSWPTASPTAESLLVRREGDEVLFLNDVRHWKGAALNLRFPVTPGSPLPAAHAVLGEERLFEGADYRGRKVLAATRQIRNTGWALVAKEDTNDIYLPIRQQANFAAMGMLALLLMAAVGSGGLARSLEADLERKTRRLSERFAHVMRQAGEAILLSTPDGVILEASQKASELYGFSSVEFQNLTLADLFLDSPGGQSGNGSTDGEVMEIGQRRKDGTVFPAEIHARLVSLGDESIRVTFARDITQQKQEDAERQAIARMIAPFSSAQDFRSLMSDLTTILQDISGCEAVGIRLREGEDFPYYETLGFPPAFVQAERQLCAYGPDGDLLRDSQGNPVLECMCGNILCGRVDPAKPFFTPHGSFVSNGTTALLASTTEADRQARTRNRCNGEGYESVALIPMRNGSEVFGLLQFNDRQPNRFTPRLVSLFERMADNLAVALARRQAQEALRKSEERIKHSMDGLIEGCQIIGFDWRFLYVNDAAARQGRKAKEAFLGRTIMEVLPGIETTELFRVLKRCLEERNTEHLVNEYSFADGSKGWFELSVQAVEEGIFLLSVDITERRKAEENLKENRALLNSIIDGTTDAIYVKDLEGRYLLFNSAAEAVVGKPRAAVLDRDDTFLFPPEEAADIMARDRKVMETGSIGTSEETRTNAKGRVATFLITKGPLYDEAGRMTGIFGISRDITDRVRLEEERRQLEAQLTQSQKMDSLGSLAGGVAHDMT